MSKELFKFKIINDDEALTSDNFYKWLSYQPEKLHFKMKAIKSYLESLGFNSDKHKVKPEELKILGYVFSMYWELWLPEKEPIDLGFLFYFDKEKKEDYFHINGYIDQFPYVKPTKRLIDLLAKTGVGVYASVREKESDYHHERLIGFHPDNYYFELRGGYLFWQYQKIIGSKRICKAY